MSAENKIRKLVEAYLVDNRHFDGVRFIDELLLIAPEAGSISAWFYKESALCFQIGNQPVWKSELSRALTKLRILCARLSVVCQERTGLDISIFGGEACLEVSVPYHSRNQTIYLIKELSIRFRNTTSEQGFVIEAM